MHRLYLSRLHPKIVSWYNRTAINDRCRCVEIRSHSKICKTSIQEFNVCNWIYGQFANFEEHASQAKPSWKPGEFTRWYELYLYKLNNSGSRVTRCVRIVRQRVSKAKLIEAYSRCEENSLAPLNWKTLFGWDRIEITIEKVDDSRWWLLSPWNPSVHPRAQPPSSTPITRKKIELARAIFETTSSPGTRQSGSLNWNQPRNQRHVNLVKEGLASYILDLT